MKSVVILAAIASVATAASAPTYKALSNPGTGKCIVIDEYDSDRNEYSLTLGSCSDGVGFTVNGKLLKTDDNYCLSSDSNSGAKGNPIVLAACKSDKPGKQWSPISSTSQWKNGYKLCLDYDSKAKTLVQNSCQSAPLPMGSMQQYTFVGGSTPPPPPPAPITCSQWSKSWICPSGYSTIANPSSVTCDGSSQNCVNKCCVYTPPPPPSTQSCGSWSVKNGGPVNACGSGYTYTAGNYDTCAANGSNCRSMCCSYVPPPSTQSCGSWSVKNGGPINACGSGYTYTAGNYDTCAANGSNCRSMCCSYVPPPSTQSCGSWSVKNGGPVNACGSGYTYTAGDDDMCAASGSNCRSICCEPSTPQTQSCGSWSVKNGGPVNACGSGYTYTAGDDDTCAANGSDCQDSCCSPLLY